MQPGNTVKALTLASRLSHFVTDEALVHTPLKVNVGKALFGMHGTSTEQKKREQGACALADYRHLHKRSARNQQN